MFEYTNIIKLKEIPMKKAIATVFFTLCSLFSMDTRAEADYVVVNNAVFNYETFGYSDALSTNGEMEYAQSLAQTFTLNASHNLSTLKWWGGMNNFFQVGDENLAGFEINIFNEDFSQTVFSTTVLNGQFTKTTLPVYNQFGGQVSMFYMTLGGTPIDAGTYHMNIGALYNSTAVQSPWGDEYADQWLWTTGVQSIENPDSIWLSFPGSPSGGWGTWYNGLPGTGTGYVGGAFVLTAPTPGAIALLALSGLVGNRRRR